MENALIVPYNGGDYPTWAGELNLAIRFRGYSQTKQSLSLGHIWVKRCPTYNIIRYHI